MSRQVASPDYWSRRKARTRLVKNVLTYSAIIFYFAVSLLPFIWIIGMSLKGPLDVLADPPKIAFRLTLDNYKAIFGLKMTTGETSRTDFLLSFKNSVVISGSATIIAICLGTLAAYALARFNFKGKEGIAFGFLSLRFAPEFTMVIPIFVIYQWLHLYNTYIGLIIMYQLIAMPLMVWVMRGYFEAVPAELEQAAQVDGYPWWEAARRVTLPMVSPGLAATSILAFIYCWNNFVFPLVLGSRDTQPLTIAIIGFISYEQVLWGQMAAAAVVTMLPELIMAMFVQRYLVRGLTFGAVKG